MLAPPFVHYHLLEVFEPPYRHTTHSHRRTHQWQRSSHPPSIEDLGSRGGSLGIGRGNGMNKDGYLTT